MDSFRTFQHVLFGIAGLLLLAFLGGTLSPPLLLPHPWTDLWLGYLALGIALLLRGELLRVGFLGLSWLYALVMRTVYFMDTPQSVWVLLWFTFGIVTLMTVLYRPLIRLRAWEWLEKRLPPEPVVEVDGYGGRLYIDQPIFPTLDDDRDGIEREYRWSTLEQHPH